MSSLGMQFGLSQKLIDFANADMMYGLGLSYYASTDKSYNSKNLPLFIFMHTIITDEIIQPVFSIKGGYSFYLNDREKNKGSAYLAIGGGIMLNPLLIEFYYCFQKYQYRYYTPYYVADYWVVEKSEGAAFSFSFSLFFQKKN
jgi:hypothetical protein